jgi:hypothetical protein
MHFMLALWSLAGASRYLKIVTQIIMAFRRLQGAAVASPPPGDLEIAASLGWVQARLPASSPRRSFSCAGPF